MIRAVYCYYFKQEISASKEKQKQELVTESLECCLTFAKDFELCPYLVSRKVCYFVWFTIQETIGELNRVENLTKNSCDTVIVTPRHRLGKVFTIEEFVIFFYQVALFAFNNFPKVDTRIKDMNPVKKLLFTLQHLERTDGLKLFMQRVGKTFSHKISFFPSKHLLR